MTRQLTARAVKAMLSRAGVDHSGLEIADDPAVWTDVETGRQATSVVIRGPEEQRHLAFRVLSGRGLACAPYHDRDYWSRRLADSEAPAGRIRQGL